MTKDEKMAIEEKWWLSLVTDSINESEHSIRDGRKYTMSWWLRLEIGLPTPKINYNLSKLVKKGLLEKSAYKNGTKYFLPYSLSNTTNQK